MDSIALCDSLGHGGVQAGRTYVEENVRIRKPGRIDRFNQTERSKNRGNAISLAASVRLPVMHLTVGLPWSGDTHRRSFSSLHVSKLLLTGYKAIDTQGVGHHTKDADGIAADLLRIAEKLGIARKDYRFALRCNCRFHG
jgi:hypothetical protein